MDEDKPTLGATANDAPVVKASTRRTPGQPVGVLKTASPDSAIATVEARLSNYLKDNPSAVTFADGTLPVSKSAGTSRFPLYENVATAKVGGPLHLVIRHLQPVDAAAVKSVAGNICAAGQAYTGYAAANPNIDMFIEAEAGTIWDWAVPYGLIVCDTGDDLDVMALPHDHALFASDPARRVALDALPQDHPARTIG